LFKSTLPFCSEEESNFFSGEFVFDDLSASALPVDFAELGLENVFVISFFSCEEFGLDDLLASMSSLFVEDSRFSLLDFADEGLDTCTDSNLSLLDFADDARDDFEDSTLSLFDFADEALDAF